MADSQTLLAHLALKLGSHPENIAVDALGYILSESESARRALQNLLQAGDVDVGPISEIRTQDSDEGGGRPDLAGRDDGGVERVLIEAKFWAGLTDNQPVAYLERLPTDKPSALVFVAPAARLEPLWAELRRRVAEAGIELGTDTRERDLQSASVDGERHLMLTSWKSLLDLMESQAGAAGNSRADIRQLLGLTQRMDEDAFLPIRSEEFRPEIPRRIRGLLSLISKVSERGRQDGWVVSPNWSGNHQTMKLADTFMWFGIEFDLWAKYHETPLWLWVDPYGSDKRDRSGKRAELRRKLDPLKEDPPGIIDKDGLLLVPIRLPVGVEETAVVDDVFRQLERVARLIDPKGFDQPRVSLRCRPSPPGRCRA